MMDKMGAFTFGDVCSKSFNIIMTTPPPIVFAEREIDRSRSSVAGRSGDLVFDKGRFKNVTIPYQCAMIPGRNGNLRDLAIDAMDLLHPSAQYRRLENSFQPYYFREARISGNISVESLVERAGKFTIEFDCKPQRYLMTGEIPCAFEEPGTILNPTNQIALPKIIVYGTGAGEVHINGTTVRIDAITDLIILDCEVENAYSEVEGSAAVNQNGNIYAPKFPTLSPGTNMVSFSGGITKLEITPRWWTL